MCTRHTGFFEIGTEVPICRSRRNIPELYTNRYRGTDFKKWLGYGCAFPHASRFTVGFAGANFTLISLDDVRTEIIDSIKEQE
eukprot:scaffold17289_cov128-Skeletonema_menzelii.AAC.1